MASLPSNLRVFGARVLIALVIAAVLMTGTVASALWYAQDKANDIEIIAGADEALDPEPDEPGNPANFLIIGSDTRAFVDTEQEAQNFGSAEEQTGQRSDTIMVIHVDPASESGMVLSFPRDLWVEIAGRGEAKINAAFNDGVDVLIETIRNNFDIEIHHALQVDFAGFEGIVDAIGSVPIYFPTPARDEETGLSSPLGGCQSLEGDQALAYVRSREYQYWVPTGPGEGFWREDPRADIGRIARQQYFIRTLAQEAIDKSGRNPFTAKRLLDETVSNLSRSESLGFSEIQRLVSTFRDLDPAVVPMETIPSTSGRAGGGQSVLFVDWDGSAPLLERMRSFSDSEPGGLEVPDIAAGDVSVKVLNGSGISGAAASAYVDFDLAGFTTVGAPENAVLADSAVTEVRYASGNDEEAFFVLLALGGRGALVEVDAVAGGDVEVVLGTDYAGVDGAQATEAAAPETTPAAAAETGEVAEPPPSTSTTVPFVLGDPIEGLPAAQSANANLPLVGCPSGL